MCFAYAYTAIQKQGVVLSARFGRYSLAGSVRKLVSRAYNKVLKGVFFVYAMTVLVAKRVFWSRRRNLGVGGSHTILSA